MELYREYPAWLIFLRRTYAVAAGVLALPFMLFWKDRRPLLQLPAPRLVENQRETGVDGSGRKGNW
ncbi:protein [Escherichia coli]|uniref:Protein n=1 Tax=Escherichia coli TaxID=562 RepID=A0A376LK29_ECOLX|nr:protein [Escherichia coli]